MILRWSIAALILAALSLSASAAEVEIKSTGGAHLGKYRYDTIDTTDALLQIPLEGRRLVSVSAGFIGNNSYREYWRFDNSALIYDKLPSGSHYQSAEFNEDAASRLICSPKNVQNCDIQSSEKISKNLIIVTYRWVPTGAMCAGLVYIDEEFYSEGYFGTYGDYYARSVSCAPVGGNATEAIALSAHYLSKIKKDGRPIARLKRYDLPKPTTLASTVATSSQTPSKPRQSGATGGSRTPVSFPVAFNWEGVSELASGTLATSTLGQEGKISAKLQGDVGDCTGRWQTKGGEWRTAQPPFGIWFMRCDSGLTASGTYQMNSEQDGNGEGTDGNGRPITFQVGTSANKALAAKTPAQERPHAKQTGGNDTETRLRKIQDLLEKGLITEAEAATRRREILERL